MVRTNHHPNFVYAVHSAIYDLKQDGEEVDAGRWQGIPTEGKPDLRQREILNLQFSVPMERPGWHDETEATWEDELALEIRPNRRWADEHFEERVGGVPMNPDPSHERWPWWRGQASAYHEHPAMGDEGATPIFTHTYSERFWPKRANMVKPPFEGAEGPINRYGVRFRYGDLNDVLNMLAKDPYTRQAYLPIFFPEDTGAVHGGRIPCTLGYHFLLRRNKLHMWYEIRSCDAVRHFRDDIYLAARLCGWVIRQLFERELRENTDQVWVDVDPGTFYFTAHSFHVHMGDYHLL